MALDPRDVPITREMVDGWLDDYLSQYTTAAARKRNPLGPFLQTQIDALELTDTDVNTAGIDSYGDTTEVLQMILDDVPSYGKPGL